MNSYYLQPLFLMMLGFYISGAFLALFFYRKSKLANIIPNLLSALASIFGLGISISYLLWEQKTLFIGKIVSAIPFVLFELRMDHLSAFFIFTLSLLTFCVSIYSMGYLRHYYQKRNLGVFNFLFNTFILSMIGVLTSSNIVAFLIFWELMSFISYFLVIFETEEDGNQRAGTIYLIMTHLATALLVIAFGLIYKYSGSLTVGSSMICPIWMKNILFICLLAGFGTKAGIIPLHIWLPYAHPAAPSNVSALMSGIMIKIAIYGMIRFIFGTLGMEYQWWGTAFLVIGIISAVLGIAYAIVETNIKKLLAYCSIENIGLILIGLGVSILAYSDGQPFISTVALLATLFHLLNHTIIKGALFLGAGAIQYSTHTKDIEILGGLLKRMPITGLVILGASLAISAIPPFNGFVSEWLIFQALFANILTISIGYKVLLIITVSAIAIAGAFAATSFIKFFGISFLGLPRSENAVKAKEVPSTMLWGMGLLSLLSLFLGILPACAIHFIDKVTYSITGESTLSTLAGHPFLISYSLTNHKLGIAPFFLVVIGIGLLVIIGLIVNLFRWKPRERKYSTWDCGFTSLSSRMQYSATGFSKPLRIIFRAIYRPSRELEIEEGPSAYFHKSMKYTIKTESVFEKYLYLPLTRFLTKFAQKFKLLVQTGSVHRYLIYIFISILILFFYFRCYN